MSAFGALKSAVFVAARTARLDRAIQHSAWRRSKLLILCYHGVSLADEHEWSDLFVSENFLQRRLTLLRQLGVRVAPLGVALDELWSGQLTEPTVALTFDDGFADFALRAAPALLAQDFPATVFLTTYYCVNQLPVFDPCSAYLMWRGAGRRASLEPLGHQILLPARNAVSEHHQLHSRLRRACAERKYSAVEKQHVLRTLSESIDIDFDALCASRLMHIMNDKEIKSLPAHLVDLQLHTHRHRIEPARREFHADLATNEKIVMQLSGDATPRRHFCYPMGEYDAVTRAHLAAYPMQSAATCDPGLVAKHGDKLRLPRLIDTMGISDATFSAWVTGFAALLPSRRADGSISI